MVQENLMVNTEVYEILNLLGNRYIGKIPTDLYEYISNNRDENYEVKFESLEELNEKNVSKKAVETVIYLYGKYFNQSEDDRNELKRILVENEKELREKYNPDNIFQKESVNIEKARKVEEENVSIIKHKESIFAKFINKIKTFFSK